MKRDLDVIRHLLLEIEQQNTYHIKIKSLVNENLSMECVAHHLKILLDTGYIEAITTRPARRRHPMYIIKGITPSGYDYLESVRPEGVWNKTKYHAASIGESLTLEGIKTVAKEISALAARHGIDTLLQQAQHLR